MSNWLFVGAGGFLGALARYGINNLSKGWVKEWPLGTLIVNLIGSFLLSSLLYGVFNHKLLNDQYRLLLMVGFCGSLTTMSTFALDVVQLEQSHRLLEAIIYFIINSLGCIFMIYVAKLLFA